MKFVPLGGYRPDHPGIKYMSQNDDIEVWLASETERDAARETETVVSAR